MSFNQDDIHVGTPPSGYNEGCVTRTVHFHGFESLLVERGRYVYSPNFMLVGNLWCLRVYPGGRRDSAEGMVSLYLENMSNKAIKIDYGFSVNDGNGKQVMYKRSPTPDHFDPQGGEFDHWGVTNFATRTHY